MSRTGHSLLRIGVVAVSLFAMGPIPSHAQVQDNHSVPVQRWKSDLIKDGYKCVDYGNGISCTKGTSTFICSYSSDLCTQAKKAPKPKPPANLAPKPLTRGSH